MKNTEDLAVGIAGGIVAAALGVIGLVLDCISTRDTIIIEKDRLAKVDYPADSLKKFDTHGLNIFANAADAKALQQISNKVEGTLARAKDSTQIAKIIPQATPAQICTTLTRLGR